MMANLEWTYKAVVVKGMLEQRLEELEDMKNDMVKKGQLDKITLKTIAYTSVVSLSVIFLLLNYFLHGRKIMTLVLFPVHAMVASALVSAFLLVLIGYNRLAKERNLFKLKSTNDRSYLFYEQEKEITETNLKTINENLKEKSKFPVAFHEEFPLEKMINYIQTGKAKNVESAFYIFKNKYPNYNKTIKQ